VTQEKQENFASPTMKSVIQINVLLDGSKLLLSYLAHSSGITHNAKTAHVSYKLESWAGTGTLAPCSGKVPCDL